MNPPAADVDELLILFPSLAEQQRIVAQLEQLPGHCDALEQRIRESRRLAQQLLQTALREALAGPGGAVVASSPSPVPEPAVVGAEAPAVPRQGRPRKPVFQRGQQINFDEGLRFE